MKNVEKDCNYFLDIPKWGAGKTSRQPPNFKNVFGEKILVVRIHTNYVRFGGVIVFPKFQNRTSHQPLYLNFAIMGVG